MKTDDYITSEKLHNTMIHTHRIVTGYDIDEVDAILDKCEHAMRMQEAFVTLLMAGIHAKGLTLEEVVNAAQDTENSN